MPNTESAARAGRRVRLRQIIRSDAGSTRARRVRSSPPARKFAGGSGRIASAGGSATTRRTAESAPANAAAAETPTPIATTVAPGA